MKNENLSKKFLTTITCPECGGRMIVEATRGNREDTFQASCFFCNECGRDTITFDDPDFEWKNDGIVLSPLQAASMHIGAGNVRKVFGYYDDFHRRDGERILFRNGGTYVAFIWDIKPDLYASVSSKISFHIPYVNIFKKRKEINFMMKENAYKSDMEPFVRGEMLFIRDSLCNRYNGYGVVYETGDEILRKASEISKHPVSKFDALIGQCITLPDNREILLYPLKPVDSSKCASVVYAQIDNEEPRENRYCKTFCLDGDLAKDHDVFVKIHEWADRIIKGGVAA